MANYMGFTTDNINIFIFVIERIRLNGRIMKMKSEEDWKNSAKASEKFPEANSIAVSICQFNEGVKPWRFQKRKKKSI